MTRLGCLRKHTRFSVIAFGTLTNLTGEFHQHHSVVYFSFVNMSFCGIFQLILHLKTKTKNRVHGWVLFFLWLEWSTLKYSDARDWVGRPPMSPGCGWGRAASFLTWIYRMTALWWFCFVFFFVPFLGKCKKCFSSHHWINYLRINWILFTVQWFYIIIFFLNLSFKLEHFNNIKNLSSFRSPFFKWYAERAM